MTPMMTNITETKHVTTTVMKETPTVSEVKDMKNVLSKQQVIYQNIP